MPLPRKTVVMRSMTYVDLAASVEMIPVEVCQRLTTVKGLRRGRVQAKEDTSRPSVPDDVVERTLPILTPVVADRRHLPSTHERNRTPRRPHLESASTLNVPM